MTAKTFVASGKMTASGFVQGLYLLSIGAAILPFGAVSSVPLNVSAMLACIAALVSALVCGMPVKGRWLFAMALFLTGLAVGWVELQVQPDVATKLLNPLWQDLKIVPLAGVGAISIQPADSIAALSLIAIPLLTFLTGLTVIRSDDDARRLTAILAVGGSLFAIYGLVQFLVFPTTNLLFPKTAYLDSLTATFVNRNTAGTFLGLVCLALARHVWSLSREISLTAVVQQVLENQPLRVAGLWPLVFAAALLGSSTMALLLTKSRGAIGSTVVALLFLMGFLALQQTKRIGTFSAPSRKKALFKVALVGVCLLLVLSLFGGRALLRVETQGSEDGRYCVLPGIFELAKSEPLFGSGFASFRHAFPPFRDPHCGIIYIWERAHNFYIEGFIGLGGIFILILLVGVTTLLIVQMIGMRNRRQMRSYSALGFSALLLVALHGLVDFSLQIPGMAAYFAALIATTSVISLGRSPRKL